MYQGSADRKIKFAAYALGNLLRMRVVATLGAISTECLWVKFGAQVGECRRQPSANSVIMCAENSIANYR
jgi:hypothetical protein